ncbi:Mut7-C RNAse domain-containing protein [Halobacterium litoreum]|uniref:Mut7-C RNAse domain-containing protein n=1 Tax=Halobacterium litoreum TaxID=2039234 RepID=A0ABD5NGV4_9EURY|nr:Mut7-C RNAse domain-containing protein [Halobacterium litoreum]UHH12684.1 Mut7-C RNAse domain-containing protein [Halobacterium litoreum]
MRLLADAMCGSLARLLRMCGHDTAYALDRGVEADDELLALAESEGRVVVTRDRQLAERAPDSILVESKDVDEQLREVAAAGVSLDPTPGARCGACNGALEALPESASRPEYVPDDAGPVWRCRDCGQCFWRGSHWEDVEKRVADV